MCRRWALRSSWLSVSSRFIAWKQSPGRLITASSMALLTLNREVSGSGSAVCSFSNVSWLQPTKPSGGFLRA